MNATLPDRIRAFLLKKPRPEIVRVTTQAGETKEIHIDEERVRWADVARTIANLGPAIIQAENSAEEILRVEKLVDGFRGPGDELAPLVTHPAMPVHSDPETARLHHFSTLLAHAWEFSTGLAFNKLADQQEREARRMEAIEARLERTEAAYRSEFHARVREQLSNMDDGNQKDSLMDAFFNSWQRGRNERGNGSAEHLGADDDDERGPRHSSHWGGDN